MFLDEIISYQKNTCLNLKLNNYNREKIAAGQVIKALILNGLGMVSRPLYLFSQFFEDKAIEKLNRTGINIAILFYLWQKSYCFLGHKQQATVKKSGIKVKKKIRNNWI